MSLVSGLGSLRNCRVLILRGDWATMREEEFCEKAANDHCVPNPCIIGGHREKGIDLVRFGRSLIRVSENFMVFNALMVEHTYVRQKERGLF